MFISSQKIREEFLNYFTRHDHVIVPSSSLIPHHDPSLLLTNSGMVQFKNNFLGITQAPYSRATSIQKCMRAGGKHNDLENVGYTDRHHTFFEMLGNFSFGDYFKHQAIKFAWDFLTKTLQLPSEKLWITVYAEDKETTDIWLNDIGVNPNRFSRINTKDNFWSMGDTGPCGPCTEIFYDHGAHVWGGPPGTPEENGDRYVEIWNLVFMQYNRNAQGELSLLPKPSVDTGMGLERIAAVMQGVTSNYDTDLFVPLIQQVADLAKLKDLKDHSLRVIADHLRASAFLIADGVIPLNEGRGYILRRIMRRALRHGYKIGLKEGFFHGLLPVLSSVMGTAYPELLAEQTLISKIMELEEEQFSKTLDQGMKILEQALLQTKNNKEKFFSGETAFKLYDTYGFPLDLTADVLKEHDLQIDENEFHTKMEQQKNLSKTASKFNKLEMNLSLADSTPFQGYELLEYKASILEIYHQQTKTEKLYPGQEGVIILDQTPFYAESGGQIGDRGYLKNKEIEFEVRHTQKAGNAIAHVGLLKKGILNLGDQVEAIVDKNFRQAVACNHSATHLLHSALRVLLGKHVQQKGSLVTDERLRFDFTHAQALNKTQLQELETWVNNRIRENYPVVTEIMTPEQAQETGAIALFGEKYGESVRVLSMGEISKELCGGTHARYTGDIGLFKIISETAIAAGIRRIEAVTAAAAISYVQKNEDLLEKTAAFLKVNPENIANQLEIKLNQIKQLEKEINQLQAEGIQQKSKILLDKIQSTDFPVLIEFLPSLPTAQLRLLSEQLKSSNKADAFLLISIYENRVNLLAYVHKQKTSRLKANEWIQALLPLISGKGGGREDFAQASGTKIDNIDEILSAAHEFLK